MSNTAEPTADFIQEEINIPECRACLRKCDRVNNLCDIFQGWSPPWLGMEATIAEDLAKIANIEVTATDFYPNSICHSCYQNLLDAATFVAKVRYCNNILQQRYSSIMKETKLENDIENNWPKPIQIDKNINSSVYLNSMEIDIKQEVLSDEDYGNESAACMELDVAALDIKVESEEIAEPPLMQITINGTMSLDPNTNNPVLNGVKDGEQHLEVVVKQEPLSEDEDEVIPDLPLGCMLCAKSFHKVSGLKAHVIAEHSYKGVKRRTGNRPSPEKKQKRDRYVCKMCKRSFTTSTDLMVHETCHNKYSCYGCSNLFDTFELLSKHRTRCKASLSLDVQRPKTLDDVLRSQLENSRDNSPAPHTDPVSDVNLVSDVKSVLDSNPVLDITPVVDCKPISVTNPVSDLNPVSDTCPVLDINPDSNVNPVSDTDPLSDNNTVTDTKLATDNNPVSDTDAIFDTKQASAINTASDAKPVPDTNLVSGANPVSDANPFPDPNPVSDTNPDKDGNTAVSQDSTIVKSEDETVKIEDETVKSEDGTVKSEDETVKIEDETVKSEDEASDGSMKLHLEIHSANQEAVPMEVSDVDVPNSVDMQVKSLRDDDK